MRSGLFLQYSSDTLVGTWLKRFEKSSIKGLMPDKPSGRPPMKPKYARMPPSPKTEEDRLRLRTTLLIEAKVAYLRELIKLRLQVKPDKDKDKELKAAIIHIKAAHPDYGHRCIHTCLSDINHKKI